MRTGTLSDKSVIANCPIYQPVPMKFVTKVLKQNNEQTKSYFNGIKKVNRSIPPRPMNINALAVALANVSDKPIKAIRTAILNELPANAFNGMIFLGTRAGADTGADTGTDAGAGTDQFQTPARRFGAGAMTRSRSNSMSDEIGRLAGRVHRSEGVQRHIANFERITQGNRQDNRVVDSYFPNN